MATTQISLIRIHSERTIPPRALWVPYELGRPLGVPNDPAFQTRVLMAAFDLLDAPEGPLLVDYPEEIAEGADAIDEEAMTGMVCPIDLPKAPDANAPTSALGQALMREIGSLAPWYELAINRRGRTTVGPSGLDIESCGKALAGFLDDRTAPPARDGIPPQRALKLAYEDLKAYYGEAITAQPGYSTSKQVENWLFNETVFGKALWTLRDICIGHDDEYFRYLGTNSIVPDRQIHPPE